MRLVRRFTLVGLAFALVLVSFTTRNTGYGPDTPPSFGGLKIVRVTGTILNMSPNMEISRQVADNLRQYDVDLGVGVQDAQLHTNIVSSREYGETLTLSTEEWPVLYFKATRLEAGPGGCVVTLLLGQLVTEQKVFYPELDLDERDSPLWGCLYKAIHRAELDLAHKYALYRVALVLHTPVREARRRQVE